MVLLHNEQLQTMIPTFIHTVVLYITYSPVSVPHTSLCRRLWQPQISIKSPTQSCITVINTELLHVILLIPPMDSRAEDNTLVPHMPGSYSNEFYSSWMRRKAAKWNCSIFNTAVQHHCTQICRKLNKHSCLLRYLFNIQCPPGLHSLEPAVTVPFHFKQ